MQKPDFIGTPVALRADATAYLLPGAPLKAIEAFLEEVTDPLVLEYDISIAPTGAIIQFDRFELAFMAMMMFRHWVSRVE